MGLRKKVFIWSAVLLILLLFSVYFIIGSFLEHTYSHLEQDQMYQKLHQLNDVYKNSLQNLGEFTHDYAAWDDTYAYILHPGKKYEASNLVPGTFATYDVDFVVYLNAGQQIVYGKQYNPITRKLENIQSTAWIRRYHLARLMRPGEKNPG